MQSIKSHRQKLIHKLDDLFTSLTDETEYNEDGKFTLDYRFEDNVGRWIIGRNNSKNGFDYVYRQRYNNTESERDKIYIYSEDYGWSETGVLLGEQNIILGLCNWVDRWCDNITFDYTKELENIFETIEEKQQKVRESYGLKDIIYAIESYNFEFLQNTIAPEGEDVVEFWKLLYSYDKDGNIIENDISIPYLDDTLFLARAERQYSNSSKTKNYSMGLVIGLDDTPDTFFVHRIERDEDLDDDSFDWNLQNIRQKMGFDIDYTDLNSNKIPMNKRTRLQGNLCVVPSNYNTEKIMYSNSIVYNLKHALGKIYQNLYIEQTDIDKSLFDSNLIYYHRSGDTKIDENASTEEIKKIQHKLNISEENVREEQDNRNIQRLSSNLRGNIVEDLYVDSFCDWIFTECIPERRKKYHKKMRKGYAFEDIPYDGAIRRAVDSEYIWDEFYNIVMNFETNLDRSTIHKLAEKEAEKTFNPKKQSNMVLGNHSVISNPSRIHPTGVNPRERLSLEKMIVPEDALVIIGHDEHNTRIYTFPKGVYEFRFLDGLNTDFFN